MSLRESILNAPQAVISKTTVSFYGQQIELRQPTIGEILSAAESRNEEGPKGIVKNLLDYAYIPGTNDKVFESGDAAALEALPFGPDIQTVMDTLNGLINPSVEAAEKNS